MLNNTSLFTDVTFIFPEDDDKQLHAHKAILCARSQKFAAMFSSGMRESQMGKVTIVGSKFDTFYCMLMYLYTSLIPSDMNLEDSILLLRLADLYMLEHLKSLIERHLQKYIALDTVISLHAISEELLAVELKEMCFKFMLKKYEDLVVKKLGEEEIAEPLLSQLNKYLKL